MLQFFHIDALSNQSQQKTVACHVTSIDINWFKVVSGRPKVALPKPHPPLGRISNPFPIHFQSISNFNQNKSKFTSRLLLISINWNCNPRWHWMADPNATPPSVHDAYSPENSP